MKKYLSTPPLPELLRITQFGESFITAAPAKAVQTAAFRANPRRMITTSNIRIVYPGSLEMHAATLVTIIN